MVTNRVLPNGIAAPDILREFSRQLAGAAFLTDPANHVRKLCQRTGKRIGKPILAALPDGLRGAAEQLAALSRINADTNPAPVCAAAERLAELIRRELEAPAERIPFGWDHV